MMFKKIVFYFLLLTGIIFPFFSHAFEIPPVGDKTDRVRDYAGVLSTEEEQALENKVHAIEDATNSQIAVVIIPSLSGEDIDELGARWAEERGVGYRGVDNGIFVLVAIDDHKRRIDVGYGLEGAVPDITAWHIGDREMVPYFKQGKYYAGLDKALDALSGAIAGEYTVEDIASSHESTSTLGQFLVGLFMLMFATLFLALLVRSIVGIPDEAGHAISEKERLKYFFDTFSSKTQKNSSSKNILALSKDDKKRQNATSLGSLSLTLLGTLVVGIWGILYIIPLYFMWKWLMFTKVRTSGGGGRHSYSSGGSSVGGGWSSGSSFGGGSFGGGGSSGSR